MSILSSNHPVENQVANSISRFLANPHVNWLHFTTRLAVRIIEQFLKPLTSAERRDCFVIDDSLYERSGYKRTELAARVFDHVSMRYKKGFRLLTLGWTDGCSFLPVNSVLLSSSKDENVLGRKVSRRGSSMCATGRTGKNGLPSSARI